MVITRPLRVTAVAAYRPYLPKLSTWPMSVLEQVLSAGGESLFCLIAASVVLLVEPEAHQVAKSKVLMKVLANATLVFVGQAVILFGRIS